jgi:Immunoglobulin-like domain of bacterial spore germination
MRTVFGPYASDDIRRAPLALVPLLLSALVLAACSSADSVDRSVAASDRERSAEVSVTGAREATVGVAAPAEETGDPSGIPFRTRPEASGGSSYESDSVLAVRHGTHEGYERVVLDLGTGDRPSESVPGWTLRSLADTGLLRVTLPSISRTAVSDGTFGDALLERFYVVRAPEDGMFVDIFTRKSFAFRVLELSGPARLVVDFKPTGSPLKTRPPAVGGNTVLVEPRAGARIGNPLTVCGYSRNFEASNIIILTDSEGKTVVRRRVLSNDWASTWGYFETTLDLPPFNGEGSLRVGTESARNGAFEGVEVPVKGR